jgi:MFS family permease
VIAIITLILMVSSSQFLKTPPQQKLNDRNNGSIQQGVDQTEEGFTWGQAIRTKQFAFIGMIYFSFLFCVTAITVHIVIHATGLNIPAPNAAFTLSLIGGACIVGMNVMGNIADRFSNKIALGVSNSLMGLSLAWLIPSVSEWSLYLFSTVFGFAYGGIQVLISPLVAELFGTRSHGVILAAGALVGSIGAALGPIIAGYIFDELGSYIIAFIICAVLAFAGLVSTLLLQTRTQSQKIYQ